MNEKLNLVVLHGWGQDKSAWQQFAGNFSDMEVTLMELPGSGNEALVSDEWGITDYSSWVEQKIGTLKLTGKVVLLGHSFGGRIASNLAAQRPKWLEALILCGAPCIYRPSREIRLKIVINKIMKRFVPYNLRMRLIGNKELVAADKSGVGKIFRRAVTFDQTNELPRINVPTLLIWGEKDEAVPLRIAKEINTLIPNSQLKVLDNLGHNAHLQNPILFYGTVKRFIENL